MVEQGFSLNAYVKDSLMLELYGIAAASSSALVAKRSGSRASPSSASTSHTVNQADVEAAAFCLHQREIIPSALLAALVLRRARACCDSVQMRAELDLQAARFEQLAYSMTAGLRRPPGQHDGCQAAAHLRRGDLLRAGREGTSLSFIAHPSCQNLLDMMWRGRIVGHLSGLQFLLVGLVGLLSTLVCGAAAAAAGFGGRAAAETVGNHQESSAFAVGRAKAGQRSCERRRQAKVVRAGGAACAAGWFCDTYDFYATPMVPLSVHLGFLCLYSYVLLFTVGNATQSWNPLQLLLAVFVLSFMVEAVKQLLCERRLAGHLAKGWNLMDFASMAIFTLAAIVFLVCGFVPGLPDSIFGVDTSGSALDTGSVKMMRICRILLGLALFFYFCRLLQNFFRACQLGPKVVMIQTMIIEDLIPFMVIFMVFVVGYGVFVWSTMFQCPRRTWAERLDAVMSLLKLAYFESFGELQVGYISGEADACRLNMTGCPDSWGRYIAPVLLGFYIVFTNVLLLNLLYCHVCQHVRAHPELLYAVLDSTALLNHAREYTERTALRRRLCRCLWNLALLIYLGCIVGDSAVSEEQLTKWEGASARRSSSAVARRPISSAGERMHQNPAVGCRHYRKHRIGGRCGRGSRGSAAQSMDWDTMHSVVRVRIREGLRDTEKQLRRIDDVDERCVGLSERGRRTARGSAEAGPEDGAAADRLF
uniref:Ion_trans domain-containing protein n=1 Tax=Macrostomum lignano TaxID=282301 RepID=A0A1I8FQG1_9PLAT